MRDRVIKEKTSLLVRDARLDEAFADRMSIVQQQIRSMLAVPLQTDDRVIGLIYLDSPHFIQEFTKDDLSLLTVMANVAAIRIEHTRLAEVEQAERMHAKQLEQAAEIQRGLLPVQAPSVSWRGFGGLQRGVPHGGRRLLRFLALSRWPRGIAGGRRCRQGNARRAADVQLAGARAGAVRRSNQSGGAGNPAQSHHLPPIALPIGSSRFFIGVLDPKTGELTYVNAGHNPPLVAHADGSVEKLEGTGLMLGILPVAHLSTRDVCHSGTGRRACCCSAMASPKPFVRMRTKNSAKTGWRRIWPGCGIRIAQSIIEVINQQVDEFTGGAPPADDITLVVAKRLAN